MAAALALTTGIQILMILLPTLTLIIATCATAARFHARKLKTLSYGADDWLALVALVSPARREHSIGQKNDLWL